jgi:hypothetical protein
MALVQNIESAASVISSIAPRLLTCRIVYSLPPKQFSPAAREAVSGSRARSDKPWTARELPGNHLPLLSK